MNIYLYIVIIIFRIAKVKFIVFTDEVSPNKLSGIITGYIWRMVRTYCPPNVNLDREV